MLKLENTEIPFSCWEATIRGMRNPLNSWDKIDTNFDILRMHDISDDEAVGTPNIGEADLALMKRLAKGGSTHAKYRRMITVYVDITAPLYWWKEFDTYKVGTVANSCSTMHKIHAKEFVLDDFSVESWIGEDGCMFPVYKYILEELNFARERFIETKNKAYWRRMIQLLPTSYNQKRTVLLNYEVLVGIYRDRRNHKLDEWHTFCDWIEKMPYSEIIIGERRKEEGCGN